MNGKVRLGAHVLQDSVRDGERFNQEFDILWLIVEVERDAETTGPYRRADVFQ